MMPHKNERVELEIKIIRYRALSQHASDAVTTQRINGLILELEKKLREIDEQGASARSPQDGLSPLRNPSSCRGTCDL
jgi:hypothetical protein